LQGIYFSIVTFLTVGFGDFFPTRTVTRIVLFPFALAGIAQLGSLIGMIVSFFSNRIEAQAAERKVRFEREREEAARMSVREFDFDAEMRFLYQLHQTEDRWRLARDLSYNLSGFLFFWVIGALIFSQIEVSNSYTCIYYSQKVTYEFQFDSHGRTGKAFTSTMYSFSQSATGTLPPLRPLVEVCSTSCHTVAF